MPHEKISKNYSDSQLYRFALFDLWNACKARGDISLPPFEEFYHQRMEKETLKVRSEIDDINLGL